MARTFTHSFHPQSQNPIPGANVDLEVSEIEDAGIREVLQTPGARYGSWSIFDTLLASTGAGSPFIFKQPLGQAREVKVALSGLFGRFVARAYLERYFKLSIFAHLVSSSLLLDGRRQIRLHHHKPGDLPDWIACQANLSSLTVAEAKGCHEPGAPKATLARAWNQARRVDLYVGSKRVSVKRIAIATRWGNQSSGPTDAHLSVRDPEEKGDPITPEEKDAVFISLLRRHIADLIEPLGNIELATAIRRLANGHLIRNLTSEISGAQTALNAATVREVEGVSIDGLIGGFVTRAGLLAKAASKVDQDALARLDLRPVFVGVERELVSAVIDGQANIVRTRLAATKTTGHARPDHAGGWVIPLGEGQHIIGDK